MLPILVATLGLVAYGRWRTDIVAAAALLAAMLLGAVSPAEALAGFGHPALAIVALLCILGAAIRNSGIIEALAGGLRPLLRWGTVRVGVFGTVGAVLSAGIGSLPVLSSMLSAAVQGIRQDREGSVPILLPIGLLAILGGLCTAVGTLPNLLLYGLFPGHFTLFGFLLTGLPVALAGLVTVLVAWRFLPQAQALVGQPAATQIEAYTSEVVVPPGSPMVGQTVHAIEARSEGAVTLKGIVRETFRRIEPRPDWAIEAHDVLVLACEPPVLQRLMERAGLSIVGGADGVLDPERIGVVEAIVTPASELVGRSPDESGLPGRRISLLAIGRSGRPPSGRLRRTKLQAGDVLMLQGELATMPGALAGLGCLTLTERRLRLGRRRQVFTPVAVLVAALALAATQTVPLVLGLLAAVLLLVVLRSLTLDELYAAIPLPVLVVIGALLPISLACRDSGVADTLARLCAPVLAHLPAGLMPVLALGLSLALAPVLGGVVTLLLLVPFAAAAAHSAGAPIEPVLLGIALGASCEFITRAGRAFALTLPGRPAPGRAWKLLLPLYGTVLAVGSAVLLLGPFQ